tara:strand:- start:1815 stop:2078 length:264 start_codon:yes stop_codon:yes gene_type:complete
MDNNLPAPYLMDTYLEGYAACLRQLGYLYPERVAMRRLYDEAVQWVRDHADDAGLYQLREIEVDWGRCSDYDERYEVLRYLLATIYN